MQELNNHENIVKLWNVLKADNDRDIYLVFEFMDTDLHAVIRANILEEVHPHPTHVPLLAYCQHLCVSAIRRCTSVHTEGSRNYGRTNSECCIWR